METLSSQEELVLLVVASQHPDAYAYGIQDAIKQELSKSVSLGTIHTILYRMEEKGWVKSRMGGSSTKRGGRSKRIYVLTAKGLSQIDAIQKVRQSLWSKIVPGQLSISSF